MNKILQGNVLEVLKTLPDESVNCIITSPPYFGLRDYGIEGQLGLEKSLEEYIERMLQITAELKRVLRKDGTMFWNHGDSYAGSGKGFGDKEPDPKFKSILRGGGTARSRTLRPEKSSIPAKSIMMQAYRLVIRMIDDQKWVLRNQIIWHKPNAMPNSVKDRFGVDFEPVFFFTKSKRYWFKQQLENRNTKHGWNEKFNMRVRDVGRGKVASHQYKATETEVKKYTEKNKLGGGGKGFKGHSGDYRPDGTFIGTPGKRGMRSVWKIPTTPFSEAHFATFPELLLEPMVLAGCPPGGSALIRSWGQALRQ